MAVASQDKVRSVKEFYAEAEASPAEEIRNPGRRNGVVGSDRSGGLQRERIAEHGDPAQDGLLVRLQEAVAPLHGGLERSLAWLGGLLARS